MRHLLFILASLGCVVLPAGALTTRNVLLLIADDLGADSLALFNDHPDARFPPTPTLDALAERGLRFQNAFAHPTCTPTRSSILTGRHPFRTGLGTALSTQQSGTPLAASELTLPEILDTLPAPARAHASIGKWHLSFQFEDPNALGGWSHYAGNILGALTNYSNWLRTEDGESGLMTEYATTRQIDDAVAWLGSLPPGQPWFLWVACNAPHSPLHKPPNHLHGYDALPDSPATPARPYYEAMVEALDTELGRLLSHVDTNDTTVIFIGDNGTPGTVIQPPHSPARAKGTPYRGGTHVPLIIAGPDVAQPGSSVPNAVHAVDLWATILELCGADLAAVQPRDRGIDSRSLLPLVLGQSFQPAETAVLTEHFASNLNTNQAARSVLDEGYKLIRFDTGVEELYHLAVDPLESTNLLASALSPADQSRFDQLAEKLAFWSEPSAPRLERATLSRNRFSLGLTAYFDHSYSLERAPSPAGPWQAPPRVLRQYNGPELTLLDPLPPPTGSVYRVTVTKP